jgi:hypothetical protein
MNQKISILALCTLLPLTCDVNLHLVMKYDKVTPIDTIIKVNPCKPKQKPCL